MNQLVNSAHDVRVTSALLTDLYELTMIQGYRHYDLNPQVVFDMFFRRQPFDGGFSVFAGLEDLLKTLEELAFSDSDLEYLDSLGQFRPDFLDYLKGFRFQGDVYAAPEGTLIFPQEPVVRIHGTLIEAQIIESLLLNIVNFQCLVATKTARIVHASNYGKVLEFGLRRAQGVNGALAASRAAYIGGAVATSNTLAGKIYGIPVSGTMAHSWVMAFENERDSFERYADLYPDRTVLLIDTFDTLGSGLQNAIEVGKRLKEKGKSFGVRLDSGDVQYLSERVRAGLDEAGLKDAKIAVSNELNEEIIHQLVVDGAPIDLWGVGTHLVTGGSHSSFSGVYKLAAKEEAGRFVPRVKLSDNPAKSTNPGIKQVYRFYDKNESPMADLIAFADEPIDPDETHTFNHPFVDLRKFRLKAPGRVEPLLRQVMREGRIEGTLPSLSEIQERTTWNLRHLDATYRRIINPHIYRVSISDQVKETKAEMLKEYMGQ
ncbi:MAG: nicotinate phosphoribosyltransferase [Spirochaetaceae bacterium]